MFFRKNAPDHVAPAADAKQVLVVDSDMGILDLASRVATPGLVFDYCDSVSKLFETSLHDYSLIILDLSLEARDWPNLIASIKQRSDASHLGVIATSSSMTPDNIIMALNCGADDYLLKPFSPREMIARVNAVIRRVS